MATLVAPTLEVEGSLPEDGRLPSLPRLLDGQWVWESYCRRFGPPEDEPQRVRLQQVLYRPGAWALASYAIEWRWGKWTMEDQFGVELAAGEEERLFRYPDDPYLPGLPRAALAPEAHDLLTDHVGLHPYLLEVEPVRYVPGTHAVLRHTMRWRRGGEATLYARVLPPDRLERFLRATDLMKGSGFMLPWVAGSWAEGGVVWVAGVPGATVRSLIRRGKAPDPSLILDGISPLWESPPQEGHAVDVQAGMKWTRHLLSHALEQEEVRELVHRVAGALGPFAEAWRPTSLAHNDFHDAQLVLTPSGRLAVVDYEEAGPGDPMLDVGNMLAHLRWMAWFGKSEHYGGYGDTLREAALARFGWDRRELALRQSYALYRLCTNPLRGLRPGWASQVEEGLRLALGALDTPSLGSVTFESLTRYK